MLGFFLKLGIGVLLILSGRHREGISIRDGFKDKTLISRMLIQGIYQKDVSQARMFGVRMTKRIAFTCM